MKKVILVLLLLLSFFLSIRYLFVQGFFPMHDDAQVARVIVMGKALSHGQFPVRMVSDLGYGYGYPLFNFYGPLPYYAGGILYAFQVSPVLATKIMIGLGVFIGSVGMYLLSSSVFGWAGGLLSTVLFLYFPYRAVQLFVRGSIGELWATSFIPYVLLGFYYIGSKKHTNWGILLGSLGFAGIILSHLISGYVIAIGLLMFTIIQCVIMIKNNRKERNMMCSYASVILVGLGLSAFFWIPALVEMGYTNVSSVIGPTANFRDHFVCLSQLWNSQWGFGGSTFGCIDGMSFKLGKFHIALGLFALLLFLFQKNSPDKKSVRGIILWSVSVLFVLIVSTLSISKSLWEIVPYSEFIQYPWRMLSSIGVCISFLSGYIFFRQPKLFTFIGVSIACVSIVFFNIKVFEPQYIYDYSDSFFETKDELQFRASKVSDEYLPPGVIKPETSTEIPQYRVPPSESLIVDTIWENETGGHYMLTSAFLQELKLNLAYFPGWIFILNNTKIEPQIAHGLVSVIVSEGQTDLLLEFRNTPIRIFGNIVTLLSIIGILTLYGKKAICHSRHTCL